MRARSNPDPDEPAEPAAETGAVLAGHRVIRLLGTGDRAVVYLGHSGTANAVALKIFHADTPPASIELDIAVLTSAAAPRLVRLLDVAQLGDGRICLILERLSGGSLAKYLIEHPRLSPGEAVTLLAPITVSLAALHSAGFAHGSLSQATILLDGNGRPVLTGFRAARHLTDRPRERAGLLHADYARLGLVLQTVCDALDETMVQRATEVGFLQRFQSRVNPQRGALTSGPTAAERQALGSVLVRLERDLFEWADAMPLRGFDPGERPESRPSHANGRTDADAAGRIDSVRIRRHIGTPRVPDGSPPRRIAPILAGSDHDRRGGVAHGRANDASNAVADQMAGQFILGVDDSLTGWTDVSPSGRLGRHSNTVRQLSGRGAALLQRVSGRAARGWARFGQLLRTRVDSHPVKAVGHALRKRLHGHQRPLLVALLGGASVLVLALTLFPVLGRAGDAGVAGAVGTTARESDIPPGTASATAPDVAETDAATHGIGVPDTAVPDGADPDITGSGADSGPDTGQNPGQPDPGQPDPGQPDPGQPAAEPPNPAAITGDDPVAAVRALLARRAICLAADSLLCLVDVDQSGSAMLALDSYNVRERQSDASSQDLPDYLEYRAVLAERNGDLAVIALSPVPGHEERQPASVLVVKGEGGWRLREIFDS
ncbi:protein kinase [Cryobacterium sp. PH29-G1]|uniref:protein kinase domain-containing protein n=1 Tax=Cryobacterium sp. PH29-G1 TaxID=3046211 RepID=UPI0024B981E5|nr:protein kinase [Cryobacterium sp. PH29-G1]MDJ0348276.1 protein kinase [Cryobacterium sp. PH29-G1]